MFFGSTLHAGGDIDVKRLHCKPLHTTCNIKELSAASGPHVMTPFFFRAPNVILVSST